MSIANISKINQLLQNAVPGGLLFSDWLRKEGYSSQLLKRYRESGWLQSLTTGVMFRNNEKLSALASIHCFNFQCNGNLRIGAHSALELYGFNHYVPMGKPKLVVFFPTAAIPGWVSSDKFDMAIQPLHTGVFKNPLSKVLRLDNLTLQVSTPEQAFMECLHLVPRKYNYMDLYYIMEQLTSLDPERVGEVLKNTSSQKVKRMFLYMAEKAGHYWVEMIDFKDIELSSSKLQLVEHGTYVAKYKITVPKDLYEYE